MKETGKGPAILRINNEKRVIAALRQQQLTSRQDLSRQLKLSKNTVSLIVDDFIAAGLVEERAPFSSSMAGRRKIGIALRPERRLSAGIMVERQHVHVRVCDAFSRVLEERTWQTSTENPQQLLAELAEHCQRLIRDHPALIGIALGFPGIIDPQRGWMHHSSHLGWQGTDLLSSLQPHVCVPLLIMNNVKAAALLSVQQMKCDPNGSSFYLRIGEGVGGALVKEGEIYTGSSWTAGEVGHLIVDPNGPHCSCGRKGCLETMISLPAVQQQFAQKAPHLRWENRTRAPAIMDALMIRAGNRLGHALGQIMLLLNPGDIMIDGPWNDHQGFIAAVRDSATQSALDFTVQRTRLHFMAQRIDPANGLALAVLEQHERIDPLLPGA